MGWTNIDNILMWIENLWRKHQSYWAPLRLKLKLGQNMKSINYWKYNLDSVFLPHNNLTNDTCFFFRFGVKNKTLGFHSSVDLFLSIARAVNLFWSKSSPWFSLQEQIISKSVFRTSPWRNMYMTASEVELRWISISATLYSVVALLSLSSSPFEERNVNTQNGIVTSKRWLDIIRTDT